MSDAQVNFIRQQGFEDVGAVTCDFQYPALMFQPRLIGLVVLTGVIFQSAPVFLTLSAILAWSTILPRLNPFEWAYNRLVAARRGLPALTPAPAPRRFSQFVATTFTLLIGVSLLAGWTTVAWTLQAFLLAALAALIFGGFCLGSYVFHLLRGNVEFARRTLPWGPGA